MADSLAAEVEGVRQAEASEELSAPLTVTELSLLTHLLNPQRSPSLELEKKKKKLCRKEGARSCDAFLGNKQESCYHTSPVMMMDLPSQHLPVESFNAPPRSKMKLWKGATFAFMLCGAALSIVLIRNMAAVGEFRPKTKYPHTPSSSSSPSSSSTSRTSPPSLAEPAALSQRTGGLHRRVRSADDNMNSLLSECKIHCDCLPCLSVLRLISMMFQSFTEGELQHVVGTLLDRKRRKSRRLGENQTRRTKRARRQRPCAVRELELTVSELGLGYESDETVLLRYCSGKCTAHRRNYDITMEHMMRTGFEKKGRKDKVSNGPCCRPIAFENDFSFLDNKSRYHTIQNVSAKNCGCV
ncbi:hypothetical protein INR49_013179 [Caranx melampygus]|nr:hypothetical protein INR49_013179 [Caranx melampygus]